MTKVLTGTTFPVDQVERAVDPIFVEPLAVHVAKRFARNVLFLPDSERPVTNAKRGYLTSKGLRPDEVAQRETWLTNRCHPLVDSVATAFSQHRPLTLSPDSIWLVIQQGFAHHVTENAEKLRPSLVRHQGKRELTTPVSEISLAGFEGGIADFSAQIREATNQVLYDALICDFSTTTLSIRTASEVVMMDAYASYFEYRMSCVCGIPRVTVKGTLEDWQRIRARVEVLEAYDLGWWVGRLRPILDEFIKTVEGNPNLDFWQAIYKPKKAYAAEIVTGWIVDLFPYLGDPPARRRSHVFDYERDGWAVPVAQGVTSVFTNEPRAKFGLTLKSFPSGLSSVPLSLKLPKGSDLVGVDLVAGFLAVEQDMDDLALSPLISWSVTERATSKPVTVV